MIHTSITKFMAVGNLPVEYQSFPVNFLNALFVLALWETNGEKKFLCSHKKPHYEMHEFKGEKNTTIIFQKEGDLYFLKIYLQEYGSPPDFEKNYGFNGPYTNKNLFVVSLDLNDKTKLKVRLGADKEKDFSLDPFKMERQPSYPFQSSSRFALLFWKSYKYMMEEMFANMSVH